MNTWIDYTQASAHKSLLNLCKKPYDLRAEGALEKDGRLGKYICRSKSFSLHYWTQRVDDMVLDTFQELSDQCELVDRFIEMKSGAVINSILGYESEQRQVLHTASRDIFTKNPCQPEAARDAGQEYEKLLAFLRDIDEGNSCGSTGKSFTTLLHVGIGGSDLGPRSIYEALKPYKKDGKDVQFISNVDPDDAAAVLRQVDLEKCLVNIVSKSGTTLETLTNEALVKRAFEEKGLDPTRHCIAVTGKGSPMDDPERYLRSFYMFDYIGGRFSSTSMVGVTTLGFVLGQEQVEDFLRGAFTVDGEAEKRDIRENLPLLLALLGLWNHNYLNMQTLSILPYCQGLHRFPAHLQQCDMESNGKSVNRKGVRVEHLTGPVVWGEVGTNGQHAFYQLLHQGMELVPLEFIGFRKSQFEKDLKVEETTSQQKLCANMLAQAVAFAQGRENENPNKFFPGNRPSSLLIGERLTPHSMGALLALYEAKIVYQGFLWGINSFDQEGVQLGKLLANQILDEMKQKEGGQKNLHRKILDVTGMA